MGDYNSEEERWKREVHQRNTDSYDALDNALGGGALDSFSSGLRDAAAASQARAEARAAELTRIWNKATAASEHIYEEAMEYYEADENEKALELFDEVLKAADWEGEYTGKSYANIADILLNHRGDFKQAIQFADSAVEYLNLQSQRGIYSYDDSWKTFAHLTRGEAYLKKMAVQSGDAKEKTKQLAIDDFQEVLDLSKKSETRYQKAAGHLKSLGVKHVGSRHPMLLNNLGGIAGVIIAFTLAKRMLGGGGFGTIAGLVAGFFAFLIVGYGIVGAFTKQLSVKIPMIIALFILAFAVMSGNGAFIKICTYIFIACVAGLIVRNVIKKNAIKREAEAKKQAEIERRRQKEANKTPEQKAADARFQQDLKLANKGDAQAQYNMGLHFYNGDGAAQNFGKAAKWWSKAAEQGHAEAKEALDKLQPEMAERSADSISEETSEVSSTPAPQQSGGSTPANPVADNLLKKAEWGDSDAQYSYGINLFNGNGVEKNVAEGIKWMTKAAELGHSTAQNRLGEIYLNGKDVPEDLEKAKYWLKKNKAKGDDRCYNTDDYLKEVNKKLKERKR